MKRSALLGIVLFCAVSAYLVNGNAIAGKGDPVKAPGKPAAAAKADGDIGSESAIYGPMTVRAVPKAAKPADPAVREEKCFECHDEIKELKSGGKHAKVNCTSCHDGTADHLKDSEKKPLTRVDLETCGGCHKDQYASFGTLNLKKAARTEKSLLTERSPNPYWDKLMMGHGFTKEHANPRSHAFMLVDHLIVDRAYGGRFQARDGWGYVSMPGPVNAWDVLVDKYPDSKEHKTFLPESAAAANPTCLQCKTQDAILKWKYLGDKDEKAKWDRTSNVVEYVKELNGR